MLASTCRRTREVRGARVPLHGGTSNAAPAAFFLLVSPPHSGGPE